MPHSIRAPLVPITVAFLVGTLWPASSVVWLGLLFGAAGLSAGVAWARPKTAWAGTAALLLLWACAGTLRMAVWQRHPEARLAAILPEEPVPVRIHGVIVDDPVQPFDPGEPEPWACVVQVRHVQTGAGWHPLAGRLRATLQPPRERPAYGDEVLLEGDWSRVPAPGNPGQYDARAALARQRIGGLLRVKPFHGVVVLRHDGGHPVVSAVFRLRRRWEQLIHRHFAPRDAGLLLSLLLGERVALDEHLKQAFVETGTVHLLVISGFNVGLIALILEWGLRLLGVPWRWRLAVSAICLGGYCLLTGMQPPVARATVMAWIVLGAYALDRVLSWPNALAAAALAITWINPTQLLDPGFQLSFGAVASLLAFTSAWQAGFEARLAWFRPAWVRRYLAVSLSSTAAVWVGLAPVLAWYFHLVSPVSMLANLLIAPLMSLLVAFGTSLLMVGAVVEPVVVWGAGPLRVLLQATVWCVTWCHALPGGSWFIGHPSLAWLLGYYGLVAVSLLRRRLGLTPGRTLLCWAVGLSVWVWSAAFDRWHDSRWLRVDVVDVGHGDSLVVRTPGGHAIVVDTGTQEAGRFRVLPFLRHEGITTLDALLLTHTDEDHIGGAVVLLEALRVKRLLTNGVRGDTMSARRLRRLAAQRHIPDTVLTAGMTITDGSPVRIEVLHPPAGLVPDAPPVSNDNSVVLKLTQGTVSILLTGDIEEQGIPWLLRQGEALRATVLKVPHHGSRLGEAGARFFQTVHPSAALLSVGRLHHLPAAETMQALARTGADIYSTRDEGAICVKTDGTELAITAFKSKGKSQKVKSQVKSQN